MSLMTQHPKHRAISRATTKDAIRHSPRNVKTTSNMCARAMARAKRDWITQFGTRSAVGISGAGNFLILSVNVPQNPDTY